MFRRCRTCAKAVGEGQRKCPCAGEARWGFEVLVSPPGAPRKRHTRTGFSTKREAIVALAAVQQQAYEGGLVEPSKVTVAEYLEEWLSQQTAAGLRPSTLASYGQKITLHVVPAIGAGRLQGLTATDLDRLYRKLLESGRSDGRGGLSPRTTRYVHVILRKSFSDAVRKNLLTRNPTDAADPPSAKAAKAPEGAVWTPGELRTFLEAVADHSLHPLFRTVAMTGLRRGEVLGLTWDAIDLDRALITVTRQLADIDGTGRPIFGPPKTDHGRRTIDVGRATVEVLRSRRRTALEERLAWGAAYRDHGLVFCKPDGAPLVGDDVSKVFIRLALRAGVPRIRFHDLRDTHASHCIERGMDIKTLSTRLGHASASFTLDVYGHLMPGQQAEAVARVEEMIDGL